MIISKLKRQYIEKVYQDRDNQGEKRKRKRDMKESKNAAGLGEIKGMPFQTFHIVYIFV